MKRIRLHQKSDINSKYFEMIDLFLPATGFAVSDDDCLIQHNIWFGSWLRQKRIRIQAEKLRSIQLINSLLKFHKCLLFPQKKNFFLFFSGKILFWPALRKKKKSRTTYLILSPLRIVEFQPTVLKLASSSFRREVQFFFTQVSIVITRHESE